MWEAIPWVTSGFTLAAFFAAVAAWVIRLKILEKEKLLRTAPEEQRGALVASALEFFHVDTQSLTKQQQFEIALQQIRARGQRFTLTTILIGVIAVIAAVVLSLVTWGSNKQDDIPTPTTHFEVIDSESQDPVLRPLTVYYSLNGKRDESHVGGNRRGTFSLPGRFGEDLTIDDVLSDMMKSDGSPGYRFAARLQQYDTRNGRRRISLDRTDDFTDCIIPDLPAAIADNEYKSLIKYTVPGAPDNVNFTCINNTNYTVDLLYYRYFPEGEYPEFSSIGPYGPEKCRPTKDTEELTVWNTFGASTGGVFYFYGSFGGRKATLLDKGYLFESRTPVLEIDIKRIPPDGEMLTGKLRHRQAANDPVVE